MDNVVISINADHFKSKEAAEEALKLCMQAISESLYKEEKGN